VVGEVIIIAREKLKMNIVGFPSNCNNINIVEILPTQEFGKFLSCFLSISHNFLK
jgi:hypothetical protein